jgi:hypothetical protein
MELRLSEPTTDALADQITTLVDAGSGPGTITVYEGTLPADLDPGTDTLLATFELVDPAAAAAAAGVAAWDLTTPIDATVAATGTAGYFVVADSDANPVLGGDVGTADAVMIFTSVNWVSGGTVSLTDGTVTQPDVG